METFSNEYQQMMTRGLGIAQDKAAIIIITITIIIIVIIIIIIVTDEHQDDGEGRIFFSTNNITVNLIPFLLPIFSKIQNGRDFC